jgi:hypothetical protein
MLRNVHGLEQLTVIVPALLSLSVICCFHSTTTMNQPVATISSPQLVSLIWVDAYDRRSTQLGKMENLQRLSTYPFFVYGHNDSHKVVNSYTMKLLSHFKLIQTLSLMLVYPLVS